MEEICGRGFSKQAVSQACAELDEALERFHNCPIEGAHPFVMVDATYLKAREGGRVRPKALLVAIGLTPTGGKEVLGVELADGETKGAWSSFLSSLVACGLAGVRVVTSDACEGLVAA